MKTTTARIAAIAASAALGLAACGGDTHAADPKFTPPASPLATRAPSPANTSTASTTPPGQSPSRAGQEAAAIALVRTYVDEYNKALQSGSTTAFRSTFKETCAVCLGDAVEIDKAFRKRQRIRGLQYDLESPRVTVHDNRQIFVEVQMSQAGGRLLTASGNVVQSFTPTVPFRFNWRVEPGTSPVIFGSDNL